MFTKYVITPVPKPRMTQRDKWQQRPAVLRYRAFADEVRAKIKLRDLPPMPWHVVFVLPMPQSWSVKKRAMFDGQPHLTTPDRDNLDKAFCDAMWPDQDSHIWDQRTTKVWGEMGQVWIGAMERWKYET